MDRDPDKLPLNLEPLERAADVLWRTVNLVQERLPPGWFCQVVGQEVELELGHRADALIEIQSPDGRRTTLVAEIRRAVVTRDLHDVVAQLRSLILQAEESLVPLVIARY